MPIEYILILILSYLLSKIIESCQKSDMDDRTKRIRERFALAIIICVLVFVAGFRYNVGQDFWVYYVGFRCNIKDCIEYIMQFKEPGIRVISVISYSVYDNGISLIFLSSLITISLYVSTLYKYSPIFVVSMLLYIFMGEWQGSFNGIRQYLASAILFSGHRYIIERKIWKYTAIVLLASLFHTTAMVMFVQYFILSRKLDLKLIVFMTISAILLLFSYNYIIGGIEFYKDSTLDMNDSYYTNSVSVYRIAVSIAPILLFLLFCYDRTRTTEQDFYLNGLIFNGMMMIATMNSTYLARIGIYTNALCLIGYAHLFQIIECKFNSKFFERCTLISYFPYWCYSIICTPALSNYNWWF